MKKVFALGIAGLLMMGTASQAMASFELGQLTMVVWDNGTPKIEKGFDLGNIETLLSTTTTQTMTINIGNNGWAFNTSSSGVGVFADASDYANLTTAGYFAITSNDPTKVMLGDNTSAWETAVKSISTKYKNDADGVIGTSEAGSYYKSMLLSANASAGKYAGMRTKSGLEAEYPKTADSSVTMYLYSFETNTETGNIYLANNEKSIATITLNNAGLVTFTATPVPVPGAALLFGSALLGLAGVRRRLNS